MTDRDEATAGTDPDLERLPAALREALASRGYATLTAVQRAVLAPEAEGRDLRIASQTGSGKTLAMGFAVRDLLDAPAPAATDARGARTARPRVLVLAPTRELARQVADELGWLFGPLGTRVACVTGGASYREEHRALAAGPALVVATPGRLLDHLEKQAVDPGEVRAIVLDEADRMLDLGFREALEAIFARLPEGRRTHLVSATFPDDVRALADRVQRRPVLLEGTRLGEANADIEHAIVLCDAGQRFDALVNVLLAHPDAKAIVFARTRADVAQLAEALGTVGFGTTALSGELDQRERERALGGFRRGATRVLVATDVAARGLDVSDVGLVIHVEPPTDPDAYTHRSGRTGRAGQKGKSVLLVAPRELALVQRTLGRARVRTRFEPVPTAAALRAAQEERLVAALLGEPRTGTESAAEPRREGTAAPEDVALAVRLVEAVGVDGRDEGAAPLVGLVARLLSRGPVAREPAPRDVRPVLPPPVSPPVDREREARPRRAAGGPQAGGAATSRRGGANRGEHAPPERARSGARRGDGGRGGPELGEREVGAEGWVVFEVNWGAAHGADPRRLLAMACRRGDVESRDVGAIDVGPRASRVQIAAHVAARFAAAARRPDPRDPRVAFRRARARPPASATLARNPWTSRRSSKSKA